MKEALLKRYGPLPMWAWLTSGTVGLLLLWYFLKTKGNMAAQAQSGGAQGSAQSIGGIQPPPWLSGSPGSGPPWTAPPIVAPATNPTTPTGGQITYPENGGTQVTPAQPIAGGPQWYKFNGDPSTITRFNFGPLGKLVQPFNNNQYLYALPNSQMTPQQFADIGYSPVSTPPESISGQYGGLINTQPYAYGSQATTASTN